MLLSIFKVIEYMLNINILWTEGSLSNNECMLNYE